MAHSYAASMEEELTCCVGFELFVDPHTLKELKCTHIICEVCLNRIKKDSAIECPQCRKITRLSKDGVAALKTNRTIRDLAEKHQRHLQHKEQQSHPSSQSSSTPDAGPDDQVPICPDHGEKMHFYCMMCHILVCRDCTVANHMRPQHQIHDVKTLRREQMKQVDATIKRLEKVATQCEMKSREIGGTEEKILSSIKTEEEKINGAVATLVGKAYEQSDILKAEIRRKNNPKLVLCQRKKELLQKQAHDLQSVIADTRAVTEVTSNHEFVTRHRALMDKLNAIPDHSDEGLVQYQPGEVKFMAEQTTLKLGTITVKQSEQDVVKKRDTAGTSTVTQSVPRVVKYRNTAGMVRKINKNAELERFTDYIRSIASNRSGDILAISTGTLFGSRHAVHIYCKQSNGQYKKQSKLDVTGPQFGRDRCYVALAADGKYLVAQDRSIHVYSPSGQYQRVCYTAPTHSGGGTRLRCITTQDNRIIAGDYARSVITVHKPDGTVLKTINTSIKPESITAINNTHAAIRQNDANKVCVIDLDTGRETLSIDITSPLGICYDEETNCLLISKMDRTIDQYSLSTGGKVATIAHDLDWSSAMIITGDGLLAVGGGKTVKLYNMSV